MADPVLKKISALVELTAPAVGDLLVISDISEALDVDKTKKITYATLIGIERIIQVTVFPFGIPIAVADGIVVWPVPYEFDGYELLRVFGFVDGPSSSGLPSFQIRNISNGNVDLLSTPITIDEGEYDSLAAATPSVVDSTYKILTAGDRLAFDNDAIGTGVTGQKITLAVKKV